MDSFQMRMTCGLTPKKGRESVGLSTGIFCVCVCVRCCGFLGFFAGVSFPRVALLVHTQRKHAGNDFSSFLHQTVTVERSSPGPRSPSPACSVQSAMAVATCGLIVLLSFSTKLAVATCAEPDSPEALLHTCFLQEGRALLSNRADRAASDISPKEIIKEMTKPIRAAGKEIKKGIKEAAETVVEKATLAAESAQNAAEKSASSAQKAAQKAAKLAKNAGKEVQEQIDSAFELKCDFLERSAKELLKKMTSWFTDGMIDKQTCKQMKKDARAMCEEVRLSPKEDALVDARPIWEERLLCSVRG